MTHFTPIDTAEASTFLRSVNPPDGSFSEHFLMPIAGFQNNGQPVMPKGFMDKFDLYLTLDASGGGGVFNTLNVTLWADPKANDGAVSVDAGHDPRRVSIRIERHRIRIEGRRSPRARPRVIVERTNDAVPATHDVTQLRVVARGSPHPPRIVV